MKKFLLQHLNSCVLLITGSLRWGLSNSSSCSGGSSQSSFTSSKLHCQCLHFLLLLLYLLLQLPHLRRRATTNHFGCRVTFILARDLSSINHSLYIQTQICQCVGQLQDKGFGCVIVASCRHAHLLHLAQHSHTALLIFMCFAQVLLQRVHLGHGEHLFLLQTARFFFLETKHVKECTLMLETVQDLIVDIGVRDLLREVEVGIDGASLLIALPSAIVSIRVGRFGEIKLNIDFAGKFASKPSTI
mmetsp:Transcript_3178/g.4539  ORF Transcript_3178/g.4539 Transcript_3178/m.4539 type:complete len:245 (-) Transcript_3178:1486-2220(-)